jgi:hypothetical protein
MFSILRKVTGPFAAGLHCSAQGERKDFHATLLKLDLEDVVARVGHRAAGRVEVLGAPVAGVVLR